VAGIAVSALLLIFFLDMLAAVDDGNVPRVQHLLNHGGVNVNETEQRTGRKYNALIMVLHPWNLFNVNSPTINTRVFCLSGNTKSAL
jgi:hypothetical protein